tara:strand:+ start:5581 stop:6306 length:726 start_codon:yes stop_codon:yes gene_type:complete
MLILVLFAISISSCDNNDDDDQTTTTEISEEEAVEAITLAVSPDAGGIIEQTTEAIYVLEDDSETSKTIDEDYECGQEYGATYTKSANTGTITYSVNYGWSWILTCSDGMLPLAADFNLDGATAYVGPNVASEGSVTASIKVENLDGAEGSYALTENFNFATTQESFVKNKNTFTTAIALSTTNLEVLKANYTITSGTITASFVGTSSNGNTYNFSGTIIFHGNQTATITMGSGNTYEIAW